jgi:hypothetical protein
MLHPAPFPLTYNYTTLNQDPFLIKQLGLFEFVMNSMVCVPQDPTTREILMLRNSVSESLTDDERKNE